jgi:RNA polymerase sigma factor (sigma-70 family)
MGQRQVRSRGYGCKEFVQTSTGRDSFATFGCGMAPEQFQTLLEAARRGDETAWAEIYRDLSPAVLGYLRGSRAPEPEDILGEVFLEVARDVGKFEGDRRRFKAWVFTIAHHRLIDARRRVGRRPVELVAEPPEPVTEPLSDAADEALARIGAEEVQRLLGILSSDQRAVLLLRILGDLSIDDTAAAIGKSPGAVKQLQRRGLATLKRELERKGVTL